MSSIVKSSSGLLQSTHADIKRKIAHQQLFGLDNLQKYLFRFCKVIVTADNSELSHFSLYDLAASVLLYGPPNTGKTSLCYLLFDQIKQEVTNDINFYALNIGGLLDPALGQSSRNLEQIFQDLRNSCSDGTSVFLVLDELDAFCMSRSRTQEHDAVRRTMTTLMVELDKLQPSTSQRFLVFGITNVPHLLDTAVVRRFALKQAVDARLSWHDFKSYLDYLNKPIKYEPKEEDIKKLYDIYNKCDYTTGDIKSLYKVLFFEAMCAEEVVSMKDRIFELFEKGFSTRQHLAETYKELSND